MRSLAKKYEEASLFWRSGQAGHWRGERKSPEALSVRQYLKAYAQEIKEYIIFDLNLSWVTFYAF